jgi:hypothetical protein
VPYHEVDQLLVEGERFKEVDGTETRRWPTQREVAERFDIAPSMVSMFATKQRCKERRATFVAGLQKAEVALQAADDASAVSAVSTVSPATPVTQSLDAASAESPQLADAAGDVAPPRRAAGRPRKAEAPVVPYEELDRLLVFGEVVQLEDGSTTTVYPTYRELARRYGISLAVIGTYAKSRNTLRRREEAKTRIDLRVDDKLIEMRADAIAIGKEEVVAMIDTYLLKFKQALQEGRVRSDNPTDVNTLVRLKEFVMGGADSRQDLRAVLSLESLQQRCARAMRNRQEMTKEQSGNVDMLSMAAAKAGRATLPDEGWEGETLSRVAPEQPDT